MCSVRADLKNIDEEHVTSQEERVKLRYANLDQISARKSENLALRGDRDQRQTHTSCEMRKALLPKHRYQRKLGHFHPTAVQLVCYGRYDRGARTGCYFPLRLCMCWLDNVSRRLCAPMRKFASALKRFA